ncbi:MAG TPA: MBL fold metallo-hydrolase [Candidatus Anaerotignum merdipullorum]|nr:MBL fold metallo-hydrolase [Candidatus Anaerotignum merdipullorum]
MLTKVYDHPTVYRIDVPLPENPLRNLNCYVIQDSGETLILDTGFNRRECLEALLAGMAELHTDWEKTNLFLTHLHSDHTGLAPTLMKDKPGHIYMSRIDYDYFESIMVGEVWKISDANYLAEGFTEEQIRRLHGENPARGYEPETFFSVEKLEDGDTLTVGKWTFQCVLVPGHTPGQMLLYQPEEKLLFTADHILFDITPNITCWVGTADSLGNYLDSLVKIRRYAIRTALPAHRKNEGNVYTRMDEIVEHHLKRMKETVDAMNQFPCSNATKIAACLHWSMRGKTWEEFPLSQRWFAVGETIAHLDYLVCRGFAEQKGKEGKHAYCLTMDAALCKSHLDCIWNNYRAK